MLISVLILLISLYVLNAHYVWLATKYRNDLGDTRSRSISIHYGDSAYKSDYKYIIYH